MGMAAEGFKGACTCLLSGLQLAAYTLPEWPSWEGKAPRKSPLLPSNMQILLSDPTDTNLEPSGE